MKEPNKKNVNHRSLLAGLDLLVANGVKPAEIGREINAHRRTVGNWIHRKYRVSNAYRAPLEAFLLRYLAAWTRKLAEDTAERAASLGASLEAVEGGKDGA